VEVPLWLPLRLCAFAGDFVGPLGVGRNDPAKAQRRKETQKSLIPTFTPMRFEVIAAFVVGVLLPVMETGRRGIGHWAVEFTTMFEDYVAGALLLLGAWATVRARSWGATFLLLAWAYFTGLMSSSFWWQLEAALRQTADEPNSFLVLVVKFLLWSTCVVSLILSFRRVATRTTT